MPELRGVTFAIIECYRRLESSVEKALIDWCTVRFYRDLFLVMPRSDVIAALKKMKLKECPLS